MYDNKDAVKKLSDAFLGGVAKGLAEKNTQPVPPTVVVTRLANRYLVMPNGGNLASARAVTAAELSATILAMLGEFTDLDAEENSKLH